MDGLVIVSVELVVVATAVCALFWQLNNNAIQQVKAALGISNSPVNEMVMAEPLTKPAPTKQPATKPKINPRPSPIPSKQPFKTPEPAKADAGDVIKRLNNLI